MCSSCHLCLAVVCEKWHCSWVGTVGDGTCGASCKISPEKDGRQSGVCISATAFKNKSSLQIESIDQCLICNHVSRGGSKISPRGCQCIIWPMFVESCMKIEKIGPKREGAFTILLCRSVTGKRKLRCKNTFKNTSTFFSDDMAAAT